MRYSGGRKGQTITSLLAAYAYNEYPLLYDLTDGEVGCQEDHARLWVSFLSCSWCFMVLSLTGGVLIVLQVHHVLQFRGNDLYVWTNLSPQEAYYMQAQVSMLDQYTACKNSCLPG